ncbi:MAG: hypothetical protein JW973_03920 [Bacteroidales bacterium]|nr:hypothetical protein [Bacteroidales bacterium]
MKSLLIIAVFFMPLLTTAQTKKDIFNPEFPLVFFGADFSQVQFTKEEEFTNKPEILRFFVDCNNLLKSPGYQNLLRKKMHRDEIEYDFSYVTSVNESIDWQKVYSDNIDYSISDEEIENMINRLNINQETYKDRIGLLLCEENYSKTKPLGTVAIVFFGVNDLKPILIKHFSCKPGGIGFLNYWGIINLNALVYLKKIEKELR